MGKGSEQTLFQRRHTNGQVHEKVLNISTNQGNANQNQNWIFTGHMLKWLLSIDKRLNASKDMEKREPFCTVGGKRKWYEGSSKN